MPIAAGTIAKFARLSAEFAIATAISGAITRLMPGKIGQKKPK